MVQTWLHSHWCKVMNWRWRILGDEKNNLAADDDIIKLKKLRLHYIQPSFLLREIFSHFPHHPLESGRVMYRSFLSITRHWDRYEWFGSSLLHPNLHGSISVGPSDKTDFKIHAWRCSLLTFSVKASAVGGKVWSLSLVSLSSLKFSLARYHSRYQTCYPDLYFHNTWPWSCSSCSNIFNITIQVSKRFQFTIFRQNIQYCCYHNGI